MPRLGANLSRHVNDAGFPARFERAAQAGFEAVEWLFSACAGCVNWPGGCSATVWNGC